MWCSFMCESTVSHLMCIIACDVRQHMKGLFSKFGWLENMKICLWLKHLDTSDIFSLGNELFIPSHTMKSVSRICLQHLSIPSEGTNNSSLSFTFSGLQQRWDTFRSVYVFRWALPVWLRAESGSSLSVFQGSPTNNVSPTSTPVKSSNAVPTLQPPPGESAAAAAAAPEPAEE